MRFFSSVSYCSHFLKLPCTMKGAETPCRVPKKQELSFLEAQEGKKPIFTQIQSQDDNLCKSSTQCRLTLHKPNCSQMSLSKVSKLLLCYGLELLEEDQRKVNQQRILQFQINLLILLLNRYSVFQESESSQIE